MEEAVEVRDSRRLDAAGEVKNDGIDVPGVPIATTNHPGGTPINPAPKTQVFAPSRRQVLSQFQVRQGIVINNTLFKVRKVTDKDLILRPVWQMPVQEPVTS